MKIILHLLMIELVKKEQLRLFIIKMKMKNDSMTDEIGTKTTVILSQNKNIENKI